MRLIDADEMLANESEAYMSVQTRDDVSPITQGLNSVVHRKIQQLIADTPTVDAVEVVRCKDCKYMHIITEPSGEQHLHCKIAYGMPKVRETDFCNHGERKSDNG